MNSVSNHQGWGSNFFSNVRNRVVSAGLRLARNIATYGYNPELADRDNIRQLKMKTKMDNLPEVIQQTAKKVSSIFQSRIQTSDHSESVKDFVKNEELLIQQLINSGLLNAANHLVKKDGTLPDLLSLLIAPDYEEKMSEIRKIEDKVEQEKARKEYLNPVVEKFMKLAFPNGANDIVGLNIGKRQIYNFLKETAMPEIVSELSKGYDQTTTWIRKKEENKQELRRLFGTTHAEEACKVIGHYLSDYTKWHLATSQGTQIWDFLKDYSEAAALEMFVRVAKKIEGLDGIQLAHAGKELFERGEHLDVTTVIEKVLKAMELTDAKDVPLPDPIRDQVWSRFKEEILPQGIDALMGKLNENGTKDALLLGLLESMGSLGQITPLKAIDKAIVKILPHVHPGKWEDGEFKPKGGKFRFELPKNEREEAIYEARKKRRDRIRRRKLEEKGSKIITDFLGTIFGGFLDLLFGNGVFDFLSSLFKPLIENRIRKGADSIKKDHTLWGRDYLLGVLDQV